MDPDYAQFYCAIPFPKTELEEMGKKNGWITTEDYSKYELNQPILNLPTLSSEQLQKARIRAYREFYLRPSYVFKRLKKIHNWNDFRKTIQQARDFIGSWISHDSSKKTPIYSQPEVALAGTNSSIK
jgi:radical SAM superfamily enzyme YgiQ (UPF0313 family)